jgi:hypothetical protein
LSIRLETEPRLNIKEVVRLKYSFVTGIKTRATKLAASFVAGDLDSPKFVKEG